MNMLWGTLLVIGMGALVYGYARLCHRNYVRRWNAWADREMREQVHADQVMQERR